MRNELARRRLRALIREELKRTDLRALVQEALHEQFYMTSSTGPVQLQQRVLH